MDYKGIEIVCPACRGDLKVKTAESLVCMRCEQHFPVLHGIPDLRIFADPYIGIEADHEKGSRIAEKLQSLSFPELVHHYYSLTPAVPPDLARRYATGVIAAQGRAKSSWNLWFSDVGARDANGNRNQLRFLDVGCGTAPLLIAAAKNIQRLAGIDISFRWLIVAKKRLMENGLDIPLFCACAEALPFPDGSFDVVGGESSIDQVRDQNKTLMECNRILAGQGLIFFSTPNRWSLGPDPQTGIPAGSWFPDRWTDALVLKKGGLPPKRKLLSASRLRKMIEDAGFSRIHVFLPDIPEEQSKHFGTSLRRMMQFYQSGKNLPGIRSLLLRFGPLFHISAAK